MQIKQLLQQIIETRAEISIDPSECPPSIRPGAEGLVRNAREKLIKLELAYQKEVAESAWIVAVSGAYAKPFALTANKESGIIAIDFERIVQELIAMVRIGSSQPLYSTIEHSFVLQGLHQCMMKYQIVNIARPIIDYQTRNVYDLPIETAIRNLISNNYGVSLYTAVSYRLIGQEALKLHFDGAHLPVLLYNCESVDTSILPQPIKSITIDVAMDANEVAQKIKMIYKNYNKTKKNRKHIPDNNTTANSRQNDKTITINDTNDNAN